MMITVPSLPITLLVIPQPPMQPICQAIGYLKLRQKYRFPLLGISMTRINWAMAVTAISTILGTRRFCQPNHSMAPCGTMVILTVMCRPKRSSLPVDFRAESSRSSDQRKFFEKFSFHRLEQNIFFPTEPPVLLPVED